MLKCFEQDLRFGCPVAAQAKRFPSESILLQGRNADMKLYTYWRSLATFRVRIALNLKGLDYEPIYVDSMPGSSARGVQGRQPADGDPCADRGRRQRALSVHGHHGIPERGLSGAPLLPADPRGRARVRALCLITVANFIRSSCPACAIIWERPSISTMPAR